jgi:hypothetical protein
VAATPLPNSEPTSGAASEPPVSEIGRSEAARHTTAATGQGSREELSDADVMADVMVGTFGR